MENLTKEKSRLFKVLFVFSIVLCVYYGTKIITEIKGYTFIGSSASTISFDGKGEVFAKPDIATVSFIIRESAKDLTTAQGKASTKEKAALSFLNGAGINEKDIKTENYNSYPKYEWQDAICPQSLKTSTEAALPTYCPPGKSILVGYEVSEYITVKVRDITKAGEILKGVGAVGASDINGPNFSVENEDALKAQARKMAIDEAKGKAKVLSRDLGVRLVRIVSFSEGGNYPMMYDEARMMASSSKAGVGAPAPILPTGENKITSNVTITYEIR